MSHAHIIQRYTTLARKAVREGDHILAETFFQKADHYVRLDNEEKGKSSLTQTHQLTNPHRTRNKINNLSVLKQTPKMRLPPNDFEMSIEQELAMAQSNII